MRNTELRPDNDNYNANSNDASNLGGIEDDINKDGTYELNTGYRDNNDNSEANI